MKNFNSKRNEKFNLLTESKFTNVVVGGQLTLSIEDARGLYNLTTIKKDEDERLQQYEKCRFILRNISKKILFTTGGATSEQDLMDMFLEHEPEETPDQSVSGQVQKIVDKM